MASRSRSNNEETKRALSITKVSKKCKGKIDTKLLLKPRERTKKIFFEKTFLIAKTKCEKRKKKKSFREK